MWLLMKFVTDQFQIHFRRIDIRYHKLNQKFCCSVKGRNPLGTWIVRKSGLRYKSYLHCKTRTGSAQVSINYNIYKIYNICSVKSIIRKCLYMYSWPNMWYVIKMIWHNTVDFPLQYNFTLVSYIISSTVKETII